jgi:A/G-specific adenine glycosylase
MLQQTQVKTVVPYYLRFLQRFPTIGHLARADLQTVLKLWEGLGYYSRARHLQQAAQTVVQTMGGQLPDQWPIFKSLPGVGDYIAAAVLSIAFGKPHAVVDGNVKRVLARFFALDAVVKGSRGHKHFQAVADRLLDSVNPGQHNQAMMELGAEICLPRQPVCGQCPLASWCKALQTGTTNQYPRRDQRPAVGQQLWVAGVVVHKGRFLLTQRPATGLLAGLWEFPSGAVQSGESPDQACVRRIQETVGLAVRIDRHLVTVRHAYTHFKLRLEVYLCILVQGRVRLDGPAASEWVAPEQLAQYPLHKAMHKALAAASAAWSPRPRRVHEKNGAKKI